MIEGEVLGIAERLDADVTLSGKGVCMAFVDVGFYPHPDLVHPQRRIRTYADVTRHEPRPEEFFQGHPWGWHGTMTACAAAGNGYRSGGRYRGLAHDADVVLIKAGEGGRIVGRHVAAALRFPLRHPELGVRVLSVSLGVRGDDPDGEDVDRAVGELVKAGVVVVAAAGNDPGQAPEPPGSAAEAITVGGADDRNTRDPSDDRPWPSSAGTRRPGAAKPDLLAPALFLAAPMLPGTLTAREGEALYHLRSLLEEVSVQQAFSQMRTSGDDASRASLQRLKDAIGERLVQGRYISEAYQHVEGTSFSAPIVASVVAQMLEANPALGPREVREILVGTASSLPDVSRAVQGGGLLNPRAATDAARGLVVAHP